MGRHIDSWTVLRGLLIFMQAMLMLLVEAGAPSFLVTVPALLNGFLMIAIGCNVYKGRAMSWCSQTLIAVCLITISACGFAMWKNGTLEKVANHPLINPLASYTSANGTENAAQLPWQLMFDTRYPKFERLKEESQKRKLFPFIKPEAKSPVLILQADNRNGTFIEKSKKINQIYAERQDLYQYEFIGNHSTFKTMPPFWAKIWIVREACERYPDVDFIVWLDTDAAVADHSLRFEHLSPFAEEEVIFIAGADTPLFHDPQDDWMNAGVFVLRNNDKGRELVDEWMTHYNANLWRKIGKDEQLTMVRTAGLDASSSSWGSMTRGEWACKCHWDDENFAQGSLNEMARKGWGRYMAILPWYVFTERLDYASRCMFVCHIASGSTHARQLHLQRILPGIT